MKISCIIVHYQIEKTIFRCIESIYTQNGHSAEIEIIVVDNGSSAHFKERLLKKYNKVLYIQAPENLGYGKGNNLGATKATGELLFFINPDTILQKNCFKEILMFWKKNPHVGIVAPSLLHPNKKKFLQQGSLILTPMRALFAHSLLHKIWPKNPIATKFWLEKIGTNKNRKVEVCPGTAFSIPKKLFKEVGLFDKNIFLYFEEYDLCFRLKKMNKEVWMLGKANIVHYWGETTQGISTHKIYQKSFKYYLEKHYGMLGCFTYVIIEKMKLLIGILMLSFLLLLLGILKKNYGA